MAMPSQAPKPLTRTESFQRMLDLEKRCRLARLHSTQTSTTADTSLNLQPRAQKCSSTSPMSCSLGPGKSSLPLWQTDSMPSLSIIIPTPGTGEGGSRIHPKQGEAAHVTTAALEERTSLSEAPGNDGTPEKIDSKENDNGSQYHEDDDQSDQSSICQSPSWEGYDQKKKNKKKQQDADHQRRESDRIEQTRKVAATKKTSNRLFKAQPGESANPAKHRKRLTGASAPVLPKSSSAVAVTTGTPQPPSRQTHGHGVRGIGESLGHPRSTSTAGAALDQLPPSQATSSADPAHQGGRRPEVTRSFSDEKGKRKEDITPFGNEKLSYPPTSSRSHILRSVVLPSHYRRNSASAVSSKSTNALQGRDAKIYNPTPVHSDSDLPAGLATEAISRGRLNSGDRELDSYVHRARTQSMERSIKGFMLEEALSSPGLTAQAENAGFLYLNQLRQQPSQPIYQRPTHAQNLPPSSNIEGSSLLVSDASDDRSHRLDQLGRTNQELREQKEDQEQAKQKPSADVRTPRHAEQSTTSTKAGLPGSNVAQESSSTPDLNPAPSTTGIFSSIKTRMSRRGSTSGGPSIASTSRSFKERAMGVMHLSSNSSVGINEKSPIGKMCENASQTTMASTSGIWSDAAERSLPGLPKPARLLGERNAETMSQGNVRNGSRPSDGSSTSSYHEGSSAPVSPASTPDTSRPQSIKGSSVGMGDTQHEDPAAPVLRQNATTTTLALPTASRVDEAREQKAEFGELQSNRSQHPNTEGCSSAANNEDVDSGSVHDLSSQHPSSQHSHTPPNENWALGLSGKQDTQHSLLTEDAQPGLVDSCGKEKYKSVSADVPEALGLCVEPVRAPKTHAVAATAATPAVGTLHESSDASVFLQPPEDERSSSPKVTSTGSSALPTGATGTENDASKTRPKNYAAHGRGHSTGAIYLQEVRRSAPLISSPLSTVIRNTAKLSSRRGGGSVSSSTPSLSATGRILPPSSSPTLSQFHLPEPAFGLQQADVVRGSSVSVGSSSLSGNSSISLSSGSGSRKQTSALPASKPNPPLAKMLVECCRCKFFHDMPSRVYECMAQPNAVVTDHDRGVSGAITTMVKCPWCSHNMRTQCCAGYAAVVYLKERLH